MHASAPIGSSPMRSRFRLTKRQRLGLRKDIDQEALERLLMALPQAARALVLREFSQSPAHQAATESLSAHQRRSVAAPIADHVEGASGDDAANVQRDIFSIRFGDPHLQQLLEAVFAPVFNADPLFAQSYRRNQQHWELCRAPISLVLTEERLDAGICALLADRPRLRPRFVILLTTRNANELILHAAIGEMLSQFTSGVEESSERVVAVGKPPDSYLEPRWRHRLSRAIQKLQSAPLKYLRGFGTVRRYVFRIEPR